MSGKTAVVVNLDPITVPVSLAVTLSGLSDDVIRKAITEGKVSAVKYGTKVLVDYPSLCAFIKGLPRYGPESD